MDKFALFHKWFWVGMVVATVGGLGGLVFGLTLLAEREHRKEGAIVTIWSLIVTIAFVTWALTAGTK